MSADTLYKYARECFGDVAVLSRARETFFDFMGMNIHATPIYISLYGPSNMCIFSSSVVLSSASITSSEKVNGHTLTTIINAGGGDSRG